MRRTLTTITMLALTASVAFAASADLSYDPAAGATWTVNSKTVVQVPMSGTKVIQLSYDLTCVANNGDFCAMKLHAPQTTDVNGQPIGPVDATFRLAPDGAVSALQSPQLNDPRIGPLLRNVGMLFPKLPGGVVDVGATWTAREVFYLPTAAKVDDGKAPKLPDKVRLDGTFKFKSLDAKGAVITISLHETPGEAIKVNLQGVGSLKPELGYGTSGQLAGDIKVKKLLMWFTVPITVQTW